MSVNETALSLLNRSQMQALQQRNAQQMKVNLCAIARNEAKVAHDSAVVQVERREFELSTAQTSHTDFVKYLRESPEQTNSAIQATWADLAQKLEDALGRLNAARSQAASKKVALDEAEQLLAFHSDKLRQLIEDHRGVLREIERLSQPA